MKRTLASLLALSICLATPAPAFAWGAAGHELVSGAAIDALPAEVPAFLRKKKARDQMVLLGHEPDRSKNAGRTHDWERDPGHYINLTDDNMAADTFSIDELPAGRSDFEAAIRIKGVKPPAPGYLPYAMIDGWQQIVKDFGIWRASTKASKNAKTAADRAWFKADAKLREMILIRDIGVWSHYVGDGSQPQHVSEHHNGWDAYPDPMTYPPPGQAKEIYGVHAFFEGPFVKTNIPPSAVRAAMTPLNADIGDITKRVPAYIKTTRALIVPLYEMVQAGKLRDTAPEAIAFGTTRLAAGASEIRDQIVAAWRASATVTVGYPNINVADIESGKVVLNRDSYGAD